jgi:ribonuclease inhibitor
MVVTMDARLDGREIHSERDVHDFLARQLDFGPYYGNNIAALRDRLNYDTPRPVVLTWSHSEISRARLGDKLFAELVSLFEWVAQGDIEHGNVERFQFKLLP